MLDLLNMDDIQHYIREFPLEKEKNSVSKPLMRLNVLHMENEKMLENRFHYF